MKTAKLFARSVKYGYSIIKDEITFTPTFRNVSNSSNTGAGEEAIRKTKGWVFEIVNIVRRYAFDKVEGC
jgi:hypothetical protein